MNIFKDFTDERLLSLIKLDDKQAFTELYRRHSKKIISLAFSKVNSIEISKEIIQDIFCDIWERRHTLQIHAFSNYLSASVKYQVISYIRDEVASKKHGNLFKAFIKISEEDTLNNIIFNDLQGAIEEGVCRLPNKTQLVFLLNRMEGKTISEIAIKLNLSEKAIKYHISKSLKFMRLHLKDFIVPGSLYAFVNCIHYQA